jgi:hypothetical protein
MQSKRRDPAPDIVDPFDSAIGEQQRKKKKHSNITREGAVGWKYVRVFTA